MEERLEQIAGRVAHAVGSEQSPDQILESAGLVAELAREVEVSRHESEFEPERARTILLAVSDDAERRRFRGLLDRLDCVVLEVRNGAEAAAICACDPGPIDLVATATSLGDMSGAELTERVVALRPAVAVICLEGDAGDDLARRVAEALELEYAD